MCFCLRLKGTMKYSVWSQSRTLWRWEADTMWFLCDLKAAHACICSVLSSTDCDAALIDRAKALHACGPMDTLMHRSNRKCRWTWMTLTEVTSASAQASTPDPSVLDLSSPHLSCSTPI